MARDETDDVLPDKDVAKEFYAKYEPKEILGRLVMEELRFVFYRTPFILKKMLF